MTNATCHDNSSVITVASPSFSGGGAERVMVILANALYARGHQVHFIVLRDNGPYKRLLNQAIPKTTLMPDSNSKAYRRIIAFRSLALYLRRHDPSILISTLRRFNMFCAVCLWTSGASSRHYVREAAPLDSLTGSNRFLNRLTLNIMSFIYKRCDGVIANGMSTRDDLIDVISLPPSTISTIPNPIDLASISASCTGIRKADVPTIVACGRFSATKNYQDLIKALPLVKRRHPAIHLYLLGEGPEEGALKNLAERLGIIDHIEFTGFVENPFAYFARAHVFVHTSRYEGFGYVLAEALACGTQVVAYKGRGGMNEIVTDQDLGELVPMGDVTSLASSISARLDAPTPPEIIMGAATRFDVDAITDDYLRACTP